jgi:hypothetical protein
MQLRGRARTAAGGQWSCTQPNPEASISFSATGPGHHPAGSAGPRRLLSGESTGIRTSFAASGREEVNGA